LSCQKLLFFGYMPLYADEALRESSEAVREDEKRALEALACTWAKAAVASDRVFGPNPTSGPRGVGEATPRAPF
jgi:hypothetical protein